MKLYHVTSPENVESILRDGLKPSGAFVSLSENPDSWYKDGMALLEVDITGLLRDIHTWLPEIDEITVWGSIEPFRIKEVRMNDTTTIKNEQFSADEYQEKAHTFACYGNNAMYPLLGLAEECGEIAGKVAKFIRKNNGLEPDTKDRTTCPDTDGWDEANDKFKEDLKGELGDACWMISEVARVYGMRMSDILRHNLDKLSERKDRGVLIGSGDTIEDRLRNR